MNVIEAIDIPNADGAFDPYTQVFNITAADGTTQIPIPMDLVDFDVREFISISISYGSQIGASFVMLVVVLAMNPLPKLLKANTLVQVAALVVSTIRMVLLSLFFPSTWTTFYSLYSGDFSRVPARDYHISVTANVFSLFLVILVELALAMQAWTMVSLWPSILKWCFTAGSALLCLVTIGMRFAFCVQQNRSVLDDNFDPNGAQLTSEWSIILGAMSICWFCALFNSQLVIHLIKNRKFLPTTAGLSPMEVLVMTNGLLMIFPVIFASLEWTDLTNFESASLTYTTVVIILPLGTLVAHRLTKAANPSHNYYNGTGAGSSGRPARGLLSTKTRVGTIPTNMVVSRVEGGRVKEKRMNPIDRELADIDKDLEIGQVRIEREIDQRRETRI